ncbi:MAG: glycosyltransferase family 4 protein [Thermodesulfobacteriota bacterium]
MNTEEDVSQDKSMKIALVHPKFGFAGGAERYATGLAGKLSGRRNDVHLFGRRFSGDFSGMVLHRIPALPLGRGIKTWSFWKLTGGLIDAGQFDIIQGFGKTTCQTVHRTGGGTHASFMAHQGRQKPSFYDRVALHIENCLFSSPRLRLVICPSRWVAGEVSKQYPQMKARLEIVPNGVDSVLFQPEGRSRDRTTLTDRLAIDVKTRIALFAATNFHLKGLDTVIRILANMDRGELVVAGGDDPAPFISLARQAGVADRIHFLGLQKDMAPLYRAADVLIHPTRYDPFANVCLEACACGTPVVTTTYNGFSDLLMDQRAGVVMPPDNDHAGTATLLMDLLQKGPGGRESARSVALENDIDVHVAAVERLYRKYAVPDPVDKDVRS